MMKFPKIKWLERKEEAKFESPLLKTTSVLINGKLFTCIILSIVSAFIDLVFFSGLSKSFYDLAGYFAIPAGLLFTIMSIGFSLGKFFCAMQLGAINELRNRLKNAGYSWVKNLNKLSIKWHVIHKFLIAVSIITSISLSVVSIGDGVRRNNNEVAKVVTAEKAISKYSNTSEKSDDIQFQNLVSTYSSTANAPAQAAEQAAKIWPIIEEYREERSEFQNVADFNSLEEVEWRGQTIIPSDYWDKRNNKVVNDVKVYRTMTLNQIRSVTSQQILAIQIKNEIEEGAKNSSVEQLSNLSEQTREKAKQEIRNLEGRFTWPNGEIATFDENNISGTLNTLSDIKAAWLNDNGDIGSSAKMFMLIGPTLDELMKNNSASLEEVATDTSVKTFGATEILMMTLICLFGIVQEFLIALFTPKSVISRKMLYQFDSYYGADFDIDRFLLSVYTDYYKKGVITQEEFDEKSKQCVEGLNITPDTLIEKYSKKKRVPREKKEFSSEVDNSVKQVEELLND